MDWEVKKAGKKAFTPITISFTVESEDELRELLSLIARGDETPNEMHYSALIRAAVDMALPGQRRDDER